MDASDIHTPFEGGRKGAFDVSEGERIDSAARHLRGRPLKRVIDVVVASIALVFLLPILLPVALLVRLTSKGPALFWTERVGLNSRHFRMPKFRTMRVDAPIVSKELLEDPRAYDTPIGRALRASSVDELPQLWCVLIGQMSLVGPRPLLPTDPATFERGRLGCPLRVRPGITGLAQIRGRNLVSPRLKARYDAVYARKSHFGTDIWIKYKTILYVITKRGIL